MTEVINDITDIIIDSMDAERDALGAQAPRLQTGEATERLIDQRQQTPGDQTQQPEGGDASMRNLV